MVTEALAGMNGMFSRTLEADVRGGRPRIAPEKLLRLRWEAMQVKQNCFFC
jgi:hypothetical protein